MVPGGGACIWAYEFPVSEPGRRWPLSDIQEQEDGMAGEGYQDPPPGGSETPDGPTKQWEPWPVAS